LDSSSALLYFGTKFKPTSKMKNSKRFFLVLFIGIGLLITSCTKNNDPEPVVYERGDVISSTLMRSVTANEVSLGLTLSGNSTTLTPTYDLDMIKLSYSTLDGDGEQTTASGTLYIPKTSGSFPMLSYQHGTLVKRTNVPTYAGTNSSETMVGALGASVGFVSCLPDYLGLGDSQVVHPYLQSDLSASAVIDMLLAAKNYCAENGIDLSNDLYICGYSEGGYVTMATQKKLEASYTNDFNLQASAPMAGPYDVEATADGLLSLDSYSSPALVGFILYAYETYYNIGDLNSIFNAPYADQIASLYDGTNDLSTINSSLTTDLTALLNQSYIQDFENNSSNSLRLAFQENSLLNWYPKTPIRLYHSVEDEIVPYSISVETEQALSAKSSSTVTLITIDHGSHTDAAVPIILNALEWFDSLQ